MKSEAYGRSAVYDQLADIGRAADNAVWLDVGHDRVLIVSVYDAAKTFLRTTGIYDGSELEPSDGITVSMRHIDRDKMVEKTSETPGPSLDTVVETLRRSNRTFNH